MVILCDAKLRDLLGCESISALGIPEMITRHHLFNQSWCLVMLTVINSMQMLSLLVFIFNWSVSIISAYLPSYAFKFMFQIWHVWKVYQLSTSCWNSLLFFFFIGYYFDELFFCEFQKEYMLASPSHYFFCLKTSNSTLPIFFCI